MASTVTSVASNTASSTWASSGTSSASTNGSSVGAAAGMGKDDLSLPIGMHRLQNQDVALTTPRAARGTAAEDAATATRDRPLQSAGRAPAPATERRSQR
jgi:hypothetical protein